MEEKNIPPVGSIVFMKDDINPAESYPGTIWETVENNIYFISSSSVSSTIPSR